MRVSALTKTKGSDLVKIRLGRILINWPILINLYKGIHFRLILAGRYNKHVFTSFIYSLISGGKELILRVE